MTLGKSRCLAGVLGPDSYQICQYARCAVSYSFIPTPVYKSLLSHLVLFAARLSFILPPRLITSLCLPYFYFSSFIHQRNSRILLINSSFILISLPHRHLETYLDLIDHTFAFVAPFIFNISIADHSGPVFWRTRADLSNLISFLSYRQPVTAAHISKTSQHANPSSSTHVAPHHPHPFTRRPRSWSLKRRANHHTLFHIDNDTNENCHRSQPHGDPYFPQHHGSFGAHTVPIFVVIIRLHPANLAFSNRHSALPHPRRILSVGSRQRNGAFTFRYRRSCRNRCASYAQYVARAVPGNWSEGWGARDMGCGDCGRRGCWVWIRPLSVR